MSKELESNDSGNAASGYNRCKRCSRRIKAPQEYGRVCAKKVKADAGKEEQEQQEQK